MEDKRPYSVKPHMFRQPLWWWLGGERDWPEWLGHEPRKSFVGRIRLIFRRGMGVRPRPISSLRSLYHRGRRGYDISDTWGLHSYLCSWMPEAIRDLKTGAIGYPTTLCLEHSDEPMFEHDPCDSSERWDAILDKIARGFEAAREIDSLASYVIDAPPEENKAREDALVLEFNEGMKLFQEWYFALWN